MHDQVDEVKQKTDIVDVISSFVALKKAGRNFKGLCPFHGEKTPSFMVSPELQIYKCFGCFPAGQIIKIPNGYQKIEDIMKDSYVISGKGTPQKVLIKYERNYSGKLITLKLSNLTEEVKLTEDHNVFVIGGARMYRDRYKYLSLRLNRYQSKTSTFREEKIHKYFPIIKVKAGKLKKHMSLLYPVDLHIDDHDNLDLSEYITKKWPKHGTKPLGITLDVPIDSNLLKLIGYYVAEGSNHRAYIRFSLGNHEEDFAKEIVFLIKKIFNIDAAIYRRPHDQGRTGIEVTACNSILANIFENLCGKLAENKHIPFTLNYLPPRKQKIILDAIFKGDGNQRLGKNADTTRKFIGTTSRILSIQIRDILLRLGLFPSVLFKKERLDKNNVHHSDNFNISWSVNPNKSKRKHIYKDKDGSYYWILPVIKVEETDFQGTVYNLMVDKDHSYIANTFMVANCGESGDTISFLENYEGMEFYEALKYLAEKANVKLKPLAGGEQDTRVRLYELNHYAAKFYNYVLTSHKLGKEALTYLTQKRGIKTDTIKKFNIGYSPALGNDLIKYLTDKKKFTIDELVRAGLVYKRGSGAVDRLQRRITFPLYDHRGNVVGFSGRILPGDKTEMGKYINSPETEIYHKSKVLYGLNLTKSEIKKKKEAIIVEGELDLISPWQAGISNIVAIKGSALTEDQVSLVGRFTNKIILALDADVAGDMAARRGIEVAQNAGMEIKVVDLKKYKDPDELARKNPELLLNLLEKPMDVWDYIIKSTIAKYDITSGSGKAKISKELIPAISTIADNIVRAHYIKILAEKLEVPEQAVNLEVDKKSLTTEEKSEPTQGDIDRKTRRQILEERYMALAFRIGPGILLENKRENFIKTHLFIRIIDELKKYQKKDSEFKINDFSKSIPKELFDGFSLLILKDYNLISEDPELLNKELVSVEKELKALEIKEKLNELSGKIKNLENLKEGKELNDAKIKFSNLTKKLTQLEVND